MTNMSQVQHGQLLHKTIRSNNFPKLKALLDKSKIGINEQNKVGDTPLLVCLKLKRSDNFIEELLSAGASITIANKKRITPLSFCAAYYTLPRTELLLKKVVRTQCIYSSKLSRRMHRALQRNRCDFEVFVIRRELEDTEKVLVRIKLHDWLYNCNIAVKELNVFLNLMEKDLIIPDYLLKRIHTKLILLSVSLKTEVAFKILWKKAFHVEFCRIEPRLLYYYVRGCKYSNLEYCECLRLILISQHAPHLAAYFSALGTTLYRVLLKQFALRDICKHWRLLMIFHSLRVRKVTIEDVKCAYVHFGFNEETVVLLRHLHTSKLEPKNCSPFQVNFIVSLEKDPKLRVNNVDNLNLIVRLSYQDLINSLPKEIISNNEVIKLKKQILNTIPTLFQMSSFTFQKSVERFYNIEKLDEFTQIIKKMKLPKPLKDYFSEETSLYYNYNLL